MVDVHPIRNEADYDKALAEIEAYFEKEPQPGSPEADRFDVLADLIEAYEARHWHIDAADPVEVIRYRMQIGNFTVTDLGELLGSRTSASAILNRKRPLTLAMVHKLSTEWNIPAEALIAPYQTEPRKSARAGKRGQTDRERRPHRVSAPHGR